MISAFPKATPAELWDIWVFWCMSVDCQGCQERTRRHNTRDNLSESKFRAVQCYGDPTMAR